MNGDIAAAAAWTPADRQYMAENQALNTFAGELAALRRRLPVTVVLPDGELLSRGDDPRPLAGSVARDAQADRPGHRAAARGRGAVMEFRIWLGSLALLVLVVLVPAAFR